MDKSIEADHPLPDRTLTDRRKSGRVDYRGSRPTALLPRQSHTIDDGKPVDSVHKALSVDDLAPTRSIVVALCIGAAMWAVVVFALWYFM